MEYSIKRLWIKKDPSEKKLWEDFLNAAGIRPEESITYSAGVFDGERLIATASLWENIIKCVAVHPAYTGGEVICGLISHMMDEVFSKEHKGCFVYTKPEAANSFFNLGFNEIARVDNKLVFLEKAIYGFQDFLKELEKNRAASDNASGIVMNANPFTKGHLYLVEYAAERSEAVHVFVLSEELSVFPSKVRLELVRRGTAHLKNVFIHETGDYMVSAKTFPSYFLKEDEEVTRIQARLDAKIFKEHIAPAMGIKKRFVGEEPYSFATNIYNFAMAEVFEGSLALEVIPRKEFDKSVISASRVREYLAKGELLKIKEIVPETTMSFILSDEGRLLQEKLKKGATK